MSTTDFVVDILLIVVIFRQLRVQPYSPRAAILPLAVVVWAGFHYLQGFRVGGHDVLLIAIFTAIGLALGLASGATTFMALSRDITTSPAARPGRRRWC